MRHLIAVLLLFDLLLYLTATINRRSDWKLCSAAFQTTCTRDTGCFMSKHARSYISGLAGMEALDQGR